MIGNAETRTARQLLCAIPLLLLLGACESAAVDQAQPPSTPISTHIIRMDDPSQEAVVYSARTVHQQAQATNAQFGELPPDRIGWTLMALHDRETDDRRYRLAVDLSYEADPEFNFRNYRNASLLNGNPGETLIVTTFKRAKNSCGGFYVPACRFHETVFVWLPERSLRDAPAEGLKIALGGDESGRVWHFDVPRGLIQAVLAAGTSAATAQ